MEFVNKYASMKPSAAFLLLGVLGLCACGGGEKDAGALPAPEVLTADSLGVHEIFRPLKFSTFGMRRDAAGSDRMNFSVRSQCLPEEKMFFPYGRIGAGNERWNCTGLWIRHW